MPFIHSVIYMGNAAASQRMAKALQAVANLLPQDYAANNNLSTGSQLANPAILEHPLNSAIEFPYLFKRFFRSRKKI